MSKSISLIVLGFLNVLHAFTHVIQLVQSFLLLKMSTESVHEESFTSELLHNPILGIIWGFLGTITLYIGIKDFIHHGKCNKK